MKFQPKVYRKGFTLVEVLIAVSVLALLAAGMWEANAYVKNKSMVNQASSELQLLEASMNEYRTDNGGILPFARGDEYSSHILYSALFCDYNNDGEPDVDNGVARMPYCPSLNVIKNTKEPEQQEGIPVVRAKITANIDGKRKVGKFFLILDPWGNPYRYRLGYEAMDENGKEGPGMNPDFDVFSLGPDGLGDGKTNDGENEDNITNIRNW